MIGSRFGLAIAVMLSGGCCPPSLAQNAFDVAVIKPHELGSNAVNFSLQPGGRFVATNVTLRMLVANAYGVRESRISGGADWVSSDRFDVTAKAERPSVYPQGAGSYVTDATC
jgi:uncharacterized protein (TIGR03435 family)